MELEVEIEAEILRRIFAGMSQGSARTQAASFACVCSVLLQLLDIGCQKALGALIALQMSTALKEPFLNKLPPHTRAHAAPLVAAPQSGSSHS